MVRQVWFIALLGLLARVNAQDDYDYDCDDCDEPEDTTTTATLSETGTCPPLSTPTSLEVVTYAASETLTVVADRIGTVTKYAATTTSFFPQPIDDPNNRLTNTFAATTETVYFNPPLTPVVFDVVSAETTVTVPIPAGFTPLACESIYAGPYSTTTLTRSYTTTEYQTVTISLAETTTTSVFPSPLIFPNVTVDSTTTITTQLTTTITSTRDDPTSTVYAACGTDNVLATAPPSPFKYLQPPFAVGTTSQNVVAIDQVDCCALCQANDRCAASSYYAKRYLGIGPTTNVTNPTCQLSLKNDTFCDQTQAGATGRSFSSILNYYSNGPCGQFNFINDQPRLVNPDAFGIK